AAGHRHAGSPRTRPAIRRSARVHRAVVARTWDTDRLAPRQPTGRTQCWSWSSADSFRSPVVGRYALDGREEPLGGGAHPVDERSRLVGVQPAGDRAVGERLERLRDSRGLERGIEVATRLSAYDELEQPGVRLFGGAAGDHALVEAELD